MKKFWHNYCKRQEVDGSKIKGDKLIMPKKYIPTQEELQEIISLYNSGISLTKMSKQLHRSKETLSKILKENNIHIRMTNETSRNIA